METSPLRFLDTDVAYLLNKAVRKAISEKSRRFHIELWRTLKPLYKPVLMYNDYDPSVHNPKQNIAYIYKQILN